MNLSTDQLEILGTRILCKRYTYPDQLPSGLFLPSAARETEGYGTPGDRAVWEPVAWGRKARKYLEDQWGMEITEPCLLMTRPHTGVYMEFLEGDRFWLSAEQVVHIECYQEDG